MEIIIIISSFILLLILILIFIRKNTKSKSKTIDNVKDKEEMSETKSTKPDDSEFKSIIDNLQKRIESTEILLNEVQFKNKKPRCSLDLSLHVLARLLGETPFLLSPHL